MQGKKILRVAKTVETGTAVNSRGLGGKDVLFGITDHQGVITRYGQDFESLDYWFRIRL